MARSRCLCSPSAAGQTAIATRGSGCSSTLCVPCGPWSSPNVETRRLYLTGQGGLGDDPPGPAAIAVCSPQSHGMRGGDWDPFGNPADLPPDQRVEDGKSVTFTTPPLEQAFAILGQPRLALEVSADDRSALVAVRLCDVDERGASTLITRGLLNLTHRAGPEHPQPM